MKDSLFARNASSAGVCFVEDDELFGPVVDADATLPDLDGHIKSRLTIRRPWTDAGSRRTSNRMLRRCLKL